MKILIVLFVCLPACAQTWFSNVTASPASNSCTVQWTTAVPTIDHLKYGLTAGSYTSSTSNGSTYSTTNAATISGLTAGTTYHFKIVAADTSKDWIMSLDRTCTTTTTTAHSVTLNWQSSTSTGVTGYNVYRSTVSGGYYMLLGNTGNLTFKDTSVQSGISYYYVVTALNSAGNESLYSNQVTAVVP
jgi:hypothetical protein